MFKFSLLVSAFTVIIGFSYFKVLKKTPKKRALLIAVGDYPRTHGWPKLSSSRDIDILQASLESYGFDHIEVVRDKQATKEGIVRAIHKSLIKKASKGDVIFLHFSGHGQQVQESLMSNHPGGVKDETDGFDEALVPYDARDRFSKGVYEGENHLSDDELYFYLSKLRKKIGPEGQILMTIDACHSGSANRGEGTRKARGTNRRFTVEDLDQSNATLQGKEEKVTMISLFEQDKSLAPIVFISAARSDQVNYEAVDQEGKAIGSLSMAIAQQLNSHKNWKNYKHFFQGIQSSMKVMVPLQSPQIQGEAELGVLGNVATKMEGIPLLSAENNQITIATGQLTGVQKGTKVTLFHVHDADKKMQGEIIDVSLASSVVSLDNGVDQLDLIDWRAIPELNQLYFSKLTIKLDDQLQGNEIGTAILSLEEQLSGLDFVVEDAQLSLVNVPAKKQLQLVDYQGELLGKFYLSSSSWRKRLKDRLMDYSRAQMMRDLSTNFHSNSVALEVVPIEVTVENDYYRVKSMKKTLPSSGVPVLSGNEPFILRVTNNQPFPVFINVLNTTADDHVQLIFPDEATATDEMMIPANTSVNLLRDDWILLTGKPYGLEVFTLLATKEPMNLKPLFSNKRYVASETRGEALTGNGAVLDNLLSGAKTRGEDLKTKDLKVASVLLAVHE